tara:strand:- start:419 stop:1474 length:1056 start_codon:yes stop_codon:yes gene_type:complete
MPIVDDERILHDNQLTYQFHQHFSKGGNGRIIDHDDNYWYICKENELSNFISLLENNIGIPIGRILHNSAADSFELILSPLTKVNFGFFGKKKRSRLLSSYWETFGWGSYVGKNHSIITNVFPSIISGFYLSLVEFDQGHRSRIQWKQVQDTLILCELEPLNKAISSPQDISFLSWSNTIKIQDTGLDILLERKDVGWSIDGRLSYVLPCDMINRVIFNLSGYVEKLSSKVSEAWHLEGIDERFSSSFSHVVQSFKELFLSGDEFVYLNEQNNWDLVISSHLKPFGMGTVKFIKCEDSIDYFEVSLEPNAPLVIGKLSGIWERANGKRCRCTISLSDSIFYVKIQSSLNYI